MIQRFAIFIGENSLGYVKGKKYLLNIVTGRTPGILNALVYNLNIDAPVTIARSRGLSDFNMNDGYCPYQSLTAFLKNWDKISIPTSLFKKYAAL